MVTAPKDISSDETRISLLENNHFHICKTLDRIESHIEKVEDKIEYGFKDVNNKFTSLDDKFDRFDEKIGRLEDRLWNIFLWMIGTVTVPVCSCILIYIGKEVLGYFHLIT